jgi:bacillolysin
MVMHINEQGQVYAVNGEYVTEGAVDTTELVTCEKAFAYTLNDPKYGNETVWLTPDCAIKIVLDKDGTAHKAWERLLGYQPLSGGPYQKDLLYASVVTGLLVARRPQVHGIMSLKTKNCFQGSDKSQCQLVSTSPDELHTSDDAINAAHNNARLTYQFYYEQFGRDSLDDKGLTLVSNVHYQYQWNNANWDGSSMSYGDGDGA